MRQAQGACRGSMLENLAGAACMREKLLLLLPPPYWGHG